MRELLRIEHGRRDDLGNHIIWDYNLTVCEGEIIYIQDISGSGIKSIIGLLFGEGGLKQGEVYIEEKKVTDYSRKTFLDHHIYTITAERDLLNELTVAENLEAIRHVACSGRYYNKKAALKRVDEYLKKEAVNINADTPLWKLSIADKQKLSILKAKMHGARLIALDCTKGTYEGKAAEELGRIIKKISLEKTAVVILSERYYSLAEIANKIQIVYQGRDLKEWRMPDKTVKGYLTGQMGSAFPAAADTQPGQLIGMFDYEWKMENSIWQYVGKIRQENRSVWDRFCAATIPADGESFDGSTAVIVRESGELLLEKLSIDENIILTIPKRLCRSKYGLVNQKLVRKITEDFYQLADLDRGSVSIQDLNRMQRKILSVYRFEVAKPRTIILENPYWGMNVEEMIMFRSYINRLCSKGIKIICFARALEEIRDDCRVIITSIAGKDVKVINGEDKNSHQLTEISTS